jgi:hypothetical protein
MTETVKIARYPVLSSHLQAVGYDLATRTLEIEFTDMSIYRYAGVPASVVNSLRAAASLGAYFHAHIRDRYPTTKVETGRSHKGGT